MNELHIPVLLEEVIKLLAPQAGESYLDLTAGYGGHASKVIELTKAPDHAVLVDRDENAIANLNKLAQDGVELINTDYYSAAVSLNEEGRQFDMILLDIGISSPHIDDPDRGFSLNKDGPLDMRMDRRQKISAETIVNTYRTGELEDIISAFGEEPRAKRVAKAIVAARPIKSTLQLAEVVRLALPGPRQKTHPATKTFQALRIAVNGELDQLTDTLPVALDLLNPGGRIAIISFHSLEDRIVKTFFKEELENGLESRIESLTKKPISGTDDVFNPRARSAKLRAALKKPE